MTPRDGPKNVRAQQQLVYFLLPHSSFCDRDTCFLHPLLVLSFSHDPFTTPPQSDLAKAPTLVADLESQLSTLNTEITDEVNMLVRRVHELGGDTGAAEHGTYHGDDSSANRHCATIADLKEKKV